jgi:hypothetical protein
MEFSNDECEECELYARPISNASAWTCVICGLKEIEIMYKVNDTVDGEVPFIWHRFQLQCGHEAHERCYKVWCKKMNAVGCSCEIREKLDANLYCDACKNFGHCAGECPIVRYLHVKQYIMASWDHYYGWHMKAK